MIRVAILISLLISFSSFAKTWATNEDQLKSCMMAIYLGQSSFHLEKHRYAENLEDLKLSKSKDCKDIEVKLKKASSDVFEAEVAKQDAVWTIDSHKIMKKIK